MDLTGPESRLLGRLMSAAALRHKVLAANVANQNTPGYKRQVVRFENLLRDAVRKGRTDVEDIAPVVVVDDLTPGRPDGNNVDLELEKTAQDENLLLFEAWAAISHNRSELIRAAIQGDR